MESLTKVTVGRIKPAKVSPSTPFVPLAPGGRPQDDASAARVAARAARESYGRLLAFLAATSRDVPAAEDALADAFAAALSVWPARGDSGQSRRLARDHRAPPPHRRRAQAAQCGSRVRDFDADRRRTGSGGRRGADPRPAPRPDVRLRSSGDRRIDPRSLDVADDPRPRRCGDRLRIPRFARRDGPASLPRQGENPPRRRSVSNPRAGGPARASRRRAGGDLRRLLARLGGGLLRRSPRPRPRRGGNLARPRRRPTRARGAGGEGPAGADALRPFPPRRPARRVRALCPVERSGHRALGRSRDHRGRSSAARRKLLESVRALSAGGRRPVRPRRPPRDEDDGLGGDFSALRRPVRPDRLACGRGQPRGRSRAHPRRGCGTGAARPDRRRRRARRF